MIIVKAQKKDVDKTRDHKSIFGIQRGLRDK